MAVGPASPGPSSAASSGSTSTAWNASPRSAVASLHLDGGHHRPGVGPAAAERLGRHDRRLRRRAHRPPRPDRPRCAAGGRRAGARPRSSPSTATRPWSCGPSPRPSCSPTSSRSSSCWPRPASTTPSSCTSTPSGPHESAEDFVDEVLVGVLRARAVVVGHDFHFGHGRRGNVELLTTLGREHGFDVLGLTLVRRRAGHGAGVVDAHPPAAASTATWRRRPSCSAATTRCGASCSTATGGAGPSWGSRRPTSAVPGDILLPGRRHLRRAGTSGPTATCTPAAISPRPPPHVLRGRRRVPARGLPPRLRRRPLRRAGQGPLRLPPAGRAALRLRRRPDRPDGQGRRRHPRRPVLSELARLAADDGHNRASSLRVSRRRSRWRWRLRSDWRFLSDRRRSLAPFDGLVARRGFSTLRASASLERRRSRARSRLRPWERVSEAATRTTGPSFSTRRARCRGPREGEAGHVEDHLGPRVRRVGVLAARAAAAREAPGQLVEGDLAR